MPSTVELIKERLGIADVVAQYLKLERAGRYYKARCPFHNERTPSFFVSPDRGTYHCFGCGKGGDLINFVQEVEGYDFATALRVLAERAGIPLSFESSRERSERERLLAVLAQALSYYEEQLARSSEARDYLASRGVQPEWVKHFRLGFAPPGWRILSEEFKRTGVRDDDAVQAGLAIRSQRGSGGVYDRFRGRIMFPLFGATGQLVGFSGRIAPFVATQGDEEAKYINSPETPLYHKSRYLYALNEARTSIRERGRAVVVEGQLDVVLAHQAGVNNAVAASGTAFTEEHVRALSRLADTLVFALDADVAGLKALARAVRLTLAQGIETLVAPLPEGRDPADLVHEQPSLLTDALERAQHAVDFFSEHIAASTDDTRTKARRVKDELVPLISLMPSAVDRAHFVKKIAERFALREEALWEDVARTPASQQEPDRAGAVVVEQAEIPSSRELIVHRLLGIKAWQEALTDPVLDGATLERTLCELVGEPLPTPHEQAVFEAEQYYAGTEHLQNVVQELFAALRVELVREEFATALERLRAAELTKDEAAIGAALKECQQLTERLEELKKERR